MKENEADKHDQKSKAQTVCFVVSWSMKNDAQMHHLNVCSLFYQAYK